MEGGVSSTRQYRQGIRRLLLLPCVIAGVMFSSCVPLLFRPAAEVHASSGGQAAAVSGGSQDQIEAGKKLYASSCVFCHGVDGNGTAAAPSLRNLGLTAGAVSQVISNGKPGTAMPGFKNTYRPDKIEDLVAYLRSFSTPASPGKAPDRGGVTATSDSASLGESVYKKNCAACHEAGGPPYLNRLAMNPATPEYILHMLTSGVMRVQGSGLSAREREAVAQYITGKQLSAEPSLHVGLCSGPGRGDVTGPQWNGWGVDLENSRFEPADQAGLSPAQVPELKLRWAFGLPGGFSAYSQPVVVAGQVFVGGPLGQVYSLDAKKGCTRWSFQADAGVRTAVTVGPGHVAYFGDLRSNVYAVDALTGKLIWRARISTHPYARVTGTPMLYKGRLYVPVSSREEWLAASPLYECCTFRGILAALDASTGKELWRTYTIRDPARPTKKNEAGTQLWGPSGAGLWSSPTIDAKRQRIYIGAGNNYTDPATPLSDSILAIDLNTGKIVWSRQLAHGDTYNVSCYRDDQSNCPAKQGPDFDFASSPILRTLGNGHRVLIVGQKSGVVFGLDPDKEGAILWQTTIGHGGPLGGVDWGPAADAELAYVALSDFGFSGGPEGTIPDPKAGGGLFALKIATGEKVWAVFPPRGGCTAPRCSPAQSAAVTAIPGVVFSGADDGHLRAYSGVDGQILWDFDTVREFDTVNKVPARGGSMDGGGPAVVGGMVFVNAGYGPLYGIAGNVLLAFAPE